jgi:ketosteroid isomerase-like protein
MSHLDEIRTLNEEYVAAALRGDVEWYRRMLADEFVCIDSDGSVLDKPAFLQMTAQEPELAEYRLAEVDIRLYGDVALVRCTGHWTARDGRPGVSRYVDVYIHGSAGWRVVSAQITRPAAP